MQMNDKTRNGFLLSAALMLSFGACGLAGAQSGQAVPPGMQNQGGTTSNCSGLDASGAPVSSNDTSCGAFAPGFAVPSTNAPAEDPSTRQVTAVVRVDAVVQKPEKTPFPVEYTAVGSATMIKVKMPRLAACFKAGKALSDRSGALTSTTCLDHKGEVIAYEECKPKTGDAPGSCNTVLSKEQSGSAVASAKP